MSCHILSCCIVLCHIHDEALPLSPALWDVSDVSYRCRISLFLFSLPLFLLSLSLFLSHSQSLFWRWDGMLILVPDRIVVVSYRIISYHLVSYVSFRISCRVISYRALSYRIISFHVVSYRILSYIVSCHVVASRIVLCCVVSLGAECISK